MMQCGGLKAQSCFRDLKICLSNKMNREIVNLEEFGIFPAKISFKEALSKLMPEKSE